MKISFQRPYIQYNSVLPNAQHYYLLNRTETPFHYPLEKFEEPVRKAFEYYQSVPQTEYIFKYEGGCTIEPVQGWGITAKNDLIYESIPFSKDRNLIFPSYARTAYFRFKRKVKHVEEAISIRYSWGNYFHFLNDAVGQLYLIEKHKLPSHIPIIVPASAKRSKHGAYFFENIPLLKQRTIIFQEDGELIQANTIYFAKNIPNVKEHFEYISRSLTFPAINVTFPKKIFLTRIQTAQRNLRNHQEVDALMKRLGFKMVDTSRLNVDEQLALFSGLTHLIAIHGAGLTNMIFNTNKDLRVMEIFPANIMPPHFFWLASEFGFDYNAQVHGEEQDGYFDIDVEALASFLQKIDFV